MIIRTRKQRKSKGMERGALRNLQGGGVSRGLPDVRKPGLRLTEG